MTLVLSTTDTGRTAAGGKVFAACNEITRLSKKEQISFSKSGKIATAILSIGSKSSSRSTSVESMRPPITRQVM